MSIDHETWTAAAPDRTESWSRAEHFLALGGTVLVAALIKVTPQLLTVGEVFALAMFPLWFPVTKRYVGARLLMLLGVLCFPAGLILSALNSNDHQIRLGLGVTLTFVMISVLSSVGFLLWAREKLSEGALVAAYGLGLVLGLSTDSAMFSVNAWKFGYALPVTILVLGLVMMTKKRWLELLVVAILGVASMAADARTSFGILLFVASLLVWQMRPKTTNRRQSAFWAVGGLAIGAVVVYNLGQALILDGLLGPTTQARTQQQIAESGSLILGGRPELMATLGLMHRHPLGFGSGTIPNYNDIQTAKEGMALINYNPNNGYVEHWMFSHGYAMHSMFGDLWTSYGLVGLALTGYVLVIVLRRAGRALATRSASAVLLYATMFALWNAFFAPFYNGERILILILTLGLVRTVTQSGDSLARPRRQFRRL
jgi:hypothetical protein